MNKLFQQVTFLTSAAKLEQCPEDVGIEVAFAGRSNAGKSSVLNTLCGQKKLARASKTPGRTRLLNFFSIDEEQFFRLVDLPGYGYAKVSHQMRADWDIMLDNYLSNRASLRMIVLIMDIRHPLQPFDLQMIHWAIDAKIAIHCVFTKADKITRGAAANTLLTSMKPYEGRPLITGQIFSSLKKAGIEMLTERLQVLYGISPENV
jgi:GTP-binding protein